MKNYWTQSENNIYVAAHRGWSEKYPENTMEAYQAAIDLNVDQLEIDIRITKDGELVLIHDATVDRTTNGTGKVCDFYPGRTERIGCRFLEGRAIQGRKNPHAA